MSTKENYDDYIGNWVKGNNMEMVNHFNYFDSTPTNGGGQHRRMPCLILTQDQISTLFNSRKHINHLSISLGLGKKEGMPAFCPIIKCWYNENASEPEAFHFDAVKASQSTLRRKLSESRIPEILAKTLCQNWMDLESNQLLNVFNRVDNSLTERVLAYKFRHSEGTAADSENHRLLSFMNSHLGYIEEFCFYLGVDLNKVANRNQFSFSPVIEVILNRKISDAEVVRLHREGILTYYNESDDSERAFFEYISPCPATC
ncbi:MAG: hypothetical protein WBA74_21860 [Cyclobacteriaceae bacterium]